jgi:tetratricopeptide (TPR) repeat protein
VGGSDRDDERRSAFEARGELRERRAGEGLEHLDGAGDVDEDRDPFSLTVAGYEQHAASAPQDVQAHFQYGRQFYQVSMWDWAILAFTRALEIAPKWADAQFYLASSLRGAGRIEEALAAYDKAKELDPTMIEARFESELLKRGKKKTPDE